MKKNLLLTALLTLVASLGMAQTSTWPITLTHADGLPGVINDDDVTEFVSELYKFDEPISKLRITVLSNSLFDSQKTDKLGTSGMNGPAFPSIAISELEVRNAKNRRISYEATSNAGSVNSGGAIENLFDATYETAFLSTTYMGACPQAYHYIELTFDSPVSEFRLKWYSRVGDKDYTPTHVGLTPGTDYYPFPEQGFKLGEQVKSVEGLAEGGLYVIEGHVPGYTHSFTGTVRSYPGGGFWHSPYGAPEVASAACVVNLLPTDKPNTYNIYWPNNDHYFANQTKGNSACNWTDMDIDAAEIKFAPCDSVPGDFIMTMHDTLIVTHESYGRMSLQEFKPNKMFGSAPRTWNFTIYKADMDIKGISFMLQEKIDEAEELLNAYGYYEAEDCGEYEKLTSLVNKGKGIIGKADATVSEIINCRNEIDKAMPAYAALQIYTYIDSVQYLLDAFDNGEMKTSKAPNWTIGTFPENSVSMLFVAASEAEETIDKAKFMTEIHNAIDKFKKDISEFWATEVKAYTTFPVRMTAENGLPGEMSTETGLTWKSPIFYFDHEVTAIRYTVFHTTHERYYGDYEYFSLSEFEVFNVDGTKIKLTEDNIKVNSVNPVQGYNIAGLCDGKYNTTFHSAWNEGQDPNGYDGSQGHAYIEVTLPKPVTAFYIRQCDNKFSGIIQDTPIDIMIGKAGVDVTPTAIGKVSADCGEVVSVTYYNLSGTSSETPFTGTINIVKKVYANGSIKTEKQYVK
jgi:hypothetical protein